MIANFLAYAGTVYSFAAWLFFMYRLTGIILLCITITSACTKSPQQSNALPQDEYIQAYFNHREGNTAYLEPYRDIKRQGDNLESVIVEQITAAKSTIELAVQELNLPLVAQALVKSHRSGVKVRVILDNNYSRSPSQLSDRNLDSTCGSSLCFKAGNPRNGLSRKL